MLDRDDAGKRTPLHYHTDDATILADDHVINPHNLSVAGTDAKHNGRAVLTGNSHQSADGLPAPREVFHVQNRKMLIPKGGELSATVAWAQPLVA